MKNFEGICPHQNVRVCMACYDRLQKELEECKKHELADMKEIQKVIEQMDEAQAMAERLAESMKGIIVNCNHKPDGWDKADKALAAYEAWREK
jgi:hypothetical protein